MSPRRRLQRAVHTLVDALSRSALPTVMLVAKAAPRRFAALVAAILIGGLSQVATMIAIASVVSSAQGAVAGHSSARHQLIVGIVAAGVLFTLQQALQPVMTGLSLALARVAEREVQLRLMDACIAPLGIAHLQDPTVLNDIAVAEGTGAMQLNAGAVISGGSQIALQWTAGVAAGFLIATIVPVTVVCIVLMLVLRRRIYRLLSGGSLSISERIAALRRVGYFRETGLGSTAAKELRIFGLERWLVDEFDGHFDDAMADLSRSPAKGWLGFVAILAVLAGVFSAVAVEVGLEVARGQIGLYQLMLLVQGIMLVSGLAGATIFTLYVDRGARCVPALRLVEQLGLAKPRSVAAKGTSVGVGDICFDEVSFSYPGTAALALHRLNLTIPAGRSMALVGPNGAGKTTVVALLARLFEPDAGRITVGGVDLRDLDEVAWRRQIAAIFQDFVHYELSARENIGFLDPDPERLERAARRSGADEIIERLRFSWETVLSPELPGGQDLSGGEWQRIALARALHAVERGAKVLVLDEPTANLDTRAEAALYERFLELTAGLTTVLVSHRFSAVRRVDNIVAMQAGTLLEQGSHTNLLEAGGWYAEMFSLQAGAYLDSGEGTGGNDG